MADKRAYPDRPKFWANQVQRAMVTAEAIPVLGRDTCWLIAYVAAREDMLHYKRVPKWWTPQLMDDAGFTNKKHFLKTRQTAIDAGWLIVNGGGKGVEGEYFTDIPVQFVGANSHQQTHQQDISRCESAPANVPLSEPTNAPLPIPCSPLPQEAEGAALPRVSSKSISDEDMATAVWMFDIVKALQPEHKIPNLAKWANVIRLMREIDGRSDADIRFLFQAADGDDFWQANIRCPSKLRAQWDKLDMKFRKSSSGGRSSGKSSEFSAVRDIVKRIWSPDIKNHREVETAIGSADLFHAAKLTGLSVISDASDKDKDKDIQRTFDAHLKSIPSTRKAKA